MYRIFHKETEIGVSRLEFGDPPMGVVHGAFLPAPTFGQFSKDVPSVSEDPQVKRWHDLRVVAPDGETLKSSGVSVEGIDFEGTFEAEITVLLEDSAQYSHYFAHHQKAYADQFKSWSPS